MGDADSTKAEKPLVNLLRGWPAPSLLPVDLLRGASKEVLSDASIYVPSLQYGPDAGFQPLREQLATWLGRLYGVPADARRIAVTGGASQNLANILQSFTDPQHTLAIWMAAPCYFLACPIFADAGFGGRLRAVREDDDGIDVSYLEAAMVQLEDRNLRMPSLQTFKNPRERKVYRHIVYVVPSCSNPTGKSMSLETRHALVHVARRHDALVICDDVYDFLQWPVLPTSVAGAVTSHVSLDGLLPRLCDIERGLGPTEDDGLNFGHAVSNASFSKIVGPGMRTGWAEATPAFAYGLSQTGSTRSGGCPSQLAAVLAWRLISTGGLDHHLSHVTRPCLQARHGLLLETLESLRKQVPHVDLSVQGSNRPGGDRYGGYFVWIVLPDHFDSTRVARLALDQQNLIVGHGAQFEVQGDEASAPFRSHIRLAFSWESEENIVDGLHRLFRVLENYPMSRKENDVK